MAFLTREWVGGGSTGSEKVFQPILGGVTVKRGCFVGSFEILFEGLRPRMLVCLKDLYFPEGFPRLVLKSKLV